MIQIATPDYIYLLPWLESIPFNTIFARTVLERRIEGTVYVNDPDTPEAALIIHPYGMALLAGRADDEDFNRQVADYLLNTTYPHARWLQVYPEEWSTTLTRLLGERLVEYPRGLPPARAEAEFKILNRYHVVKCTRVNFKFTAPRYQASPALNLPDGLEIAAVSRSIFEEMPGTVIPRYFWPDFASFKSEGAGFCLMRQKAVLSVCFTAFVKDDIFEIGIETSAKQRGLGYARLAARAFIDHCLKTGRQPEWSCRKENTGSYLLARQLGFEVVHEHPYYGLADSSR